MFNYDAGTNTLSWNSGEEQIIAVRITPTSTVTSPTVQLYKGSSDVTSTYTSGSVSVSQDGDVTIFTTSKFLSTLPPNTYKLHLKGTMDSQAKDLYTFNVVVLKRGN